MTDNNTDTSVELIDEQTVFTLSELCRSCSVEAEFIEALIEHGIVDPLPGARKHYRFTATSLRRTRVTVSLQRDLGVNLPGAALALDLLERIDEMEAQLRQMQTPDPGR
jgi:chaperone modulatory protein CbpM